jgi:hypothetical protein
MRRKAIKEQFIEPSPLDVWKSMLHDYENKTSANIAEASEQIASVQERIRGAFHLGRLSLTWTLY